MSLGKAKTRIKEGVEEVQSAKGMKRVAINFGIGVSIGVIVDLIFQYIWTALVTQPPDEPESVWRTDLRKGLVGFSIFPNMLTPDGEPYMPWDDVMLLIITIALLFSKKLWLVIGFFTGWYLSSYMGLYSAMVTPFEPSEG